MLGVNVFAAETDDEGRRLFSSLQQAFVNLRRGHPGKLPPPDDGFVERLHPGDRRLLDEMLSCSVVGSPATVQRGLEAFAARTGADELMVASQIYDHEARLRSYELVAGTPC
jgi:alkanesulfonate monooxygenase SsuD/methylene tetrahydromethanopterin reductase-like flavin-dependent oxidoreductase (luciferase family)